MVNNTDIESRICRLIVDDLDWSGDPQTLVGPEPQKLPEIFDSAALLELASILEDEFDIEIDDEEIVPEKFATVSALAETVAVKAA